MVDSLRQPARWGCSSGRPLGRLPPVTCPTFIERTSYLVTAPQGSRHAHVMHLTVDKGLSGMGQGLHYSGLSCVLAQQGASLRSVAMAPEAAAATSGSIMLGHPAPQCNLPALAGPGRPDSPCAGCGCPKEWVAGTRPSDVVDLLIEETFNNYQGHNLVGRRKLNVVYML